MAGDCELRGSKGSIPWQLLLRIGFGLRAPRRKVFGQDLSGEVESIGNRVTLFKKGDRIYGNTGFRLGAYAEYACLPESGLVAAMPRNLTFDEAVTFPSAGLYVLPLLSKVDARDGQEVMVIGAAGTMGNLTVQLCKMSGATVTGVDSTSKRDFVRSAGADKVIDYTREDYTKGGEAYDAIFDVTGKSPFSGCIRILKKGGIYVMGNLGISRSIRGRWASMTEGKRIVAGYARYTKSDLDKLSEFIQEGKLKPMIDRRYPLEQIVEAHRYVESGEKKGSVVITV